MCQNLYILISHTLIGSLTIENEKKCGTMIVGGLNFYAKQIIQFKSPFSPLI